MDFAASTTAQATNALLDFLKLKASEAGIPLEYQELGVAGIIPKLGVRAANTAGHVLYLEVTFQPMGDVRISQQINPAKREFGTGLITKRGARVNLELRLDRDNQFRWYCEPIELNESVRKVIPNRNGAPFVLTEEYVADGFKFLQE